MNATNNHGHSHRNDERPITDRAHPRIYSILIAFTALFVVATWSFIGNGIVDYLLAIVGGFMFVAVVLTLILFQVGSKRGAAAEDEEPSLRDWAAGDYDTWTGRLRGAEAATQILLPIAAAAVGMTIIGIVFVVAEHAAT
jgi:hypothetical protein